MITLIDWVTVLGPTWHKIGHLGDILQAKVMEKLNLTQQKHTFTNQKKRTATQNKHEKQASSPPMTSGLETDRAF